MNISRRLARLRQDDSGNALVMVIGLGFTFVILAATMAISSTFAAATSNTARAGVQVQAAADAGIDGALKQLNNVIIGQESTFRCEINSTVSTTKGDVTVVTKLGYRLAGSPDDAPFECKAPYADGSEMIAAQMVSTANMRIAGPSGGRDVVRSVKQTVGLTPGDPLPPLFKYGVFSHGGLDTTNNFKVSGGGVFTNGTFGCNSSASVYGDVTAVGNATLSNAGCYIASLWTGGTATCSSKATVGGSVVAAGTGKSYFSSGCKVGTDENLGGIWTAGNLELQGTTVAGDLLSAQGSITLHSATVKGWAQAATTVTGVTVNKARVPNLPSEAPASPETQKMPTIYYSDLVGPKAGDPTVIKYGDWIKENAVRNGGKNADMLKGTYCDGQVANASWSVGGHLEGPKTASVIDARGCKLQFLGASGALKLTVHADTTIVVKDFYSSNGLLIKGADPTKQYVVRFIVPLPEGAPSCTVKPPTGEANITINSGGTAFDSNVATFVYTNGKAELTNGVKFHGSLYACETNVSVNTDITYSDGTPPGMTDDSDKKYNFMPIMRFDVRS